MLFFRKRYICTLSAIHAPRASEGVYSLSRGLPGLGETNVETLLLSVYMVFVFKVLDVLDVLDVFDR